MNASAKQPLHVDRSGARLGQVDDRGREPAPHDASLEASWADHIARMHLAQGGNPAELTMLRTTAIELLRSARRGDSCLRVDGRWPVTPLVTTLDTASGRWPGEPVGRSADATPWIAQWGHLFLRRLWLAEDALAGRLLAMNAAAFEPAGPMGEDTARDVARELQRIGSRYDPAPEQLEAVQVGLTRRLLLLTGGPGTGKTFTLARLIDAVQRVFPEARIALAAPTGKASSRLAQALAGNDANATLRVQTVHSLLGLRGAGQTSRYGAHRPLPFEWVVVDESSMLGLELASLLVQALPENARLVLAGDSDQLASVEPGSVFADLIRAGASGLAGSVVGLTRNFRQREAPALAAFSRLLQEGAALRWPPPQDEPASGEPDAAELVSTSTSRSASVSASTSTSASLSASVSTLEFRNVALSRAQALVGLASSRFAELAASASDAAGRLAQLNRYRVLSALRAGAWGSVQLARGIDAELRMRSGAESRETWYEGRLVILTRNLRGAGRVNGDVGLCYRSEGRWWALFEDSGGTHSSLPVTQLAGAEPAWCLTVHKSQGSEFDEVDLVLPPKDSPLARRELVYTGATRARKRLRVWGEPEGLEQSVASSIERRGTLAQRLARTPPMAD